MSATNKTAIYELPIFLGTDVPSWLTDWNGAMGVIDNAIAAAKAAADAAASTAGTAAADIVTIQGNITSLQGTVGTHTTQINTISGSINTINSLIGNGTPTTTDHTIIGAINELNAVKEEKLSKVAEGTANTTYAAQLAEIKTVYDTLTLDQKLRSVLVVGDNVILVPSGLTNGAYASSGMSGTNLFQYSINLQYALYRSSDIQAASGNVTITDNSNTVFADTVKLYA